MFYKDANVFDEALRRINLLFDSFDDIIVSMSGGKDSAVLFNLTLMVAKERGLLPLKVFWLDQEAEWGATVDYMSKIMHMPEVKPYWFQIPFDFTNSLSTQDNFLRVWDEAEQDKWIHPKADVSIKENPTKYTRFHDLVNHLPECCVEDGKKAAVLVGMRTQESLNRYTTIGFGKGYFKGETWCKKPGKKTQTFWPIYDFTIDDVFAAIAKNHWDYNKVYDFMYQYGVPKYKMRVSALIHETAWYNVKFLQEFEPSTYDRFARRVSGISTFNHAFDEGGIMPKDLPFAFKDWKEYRDYLLVHIVKPEYHELFRNRWKGQEGEMWYKIHAKECIVNDIDGTRNANRVTKARQLKLSGRGKDPKENKFYKRDKAQFDAWQKEKEREGKPHD